MEVFVRLQRQPPLGVLEDVGYDLIGVGARAGLQVIVPGLDRLPPCIQQVLRIRRKNDFHLVSMGQHNGAAGFGRDGYPIDRSGKRVCAVGFDGNGLMVAVQQTDEGIVRLQRGLAAGENNQCIGMRAIGKHPLGYLLRSHLLAVGKIRVTKRAAQIASGKTDEHGSTTCVEPLALKGEEYFVDAIHGYFLFDVV